MNRPEDTSMEDVTLKGNILVVDDNPANLRLLSGMLVEDGYKVRAVINGPMALTAAQASPPDLVLLDINMPEMDGYQICARLKADARTADVPVIFISAMDQVEEKVRAFEVGGVDYVAHIHFGASLQDVATLKDAEEEGGYEVRLFDSGSGTGRMFFWNNDPPDEDLRNLYRTPQFKRAMSHAVDRATIQKIVYYNTG